jgi:oligopeptide transport system substrate-binding protein
MPFMKKIRAVVVAVAIILSLCGCSKEASKSGTPKKKITQRIRAAIFPQPKSLIPIEGEHYVDGQFTEIIFNNLVQANYLGNLSPELASSWEISPDHREYTFHLRKNVRFHNGRPFTAADVVFTLEKLIEKAQGKYAEINYVDGYEDFLNKRAGQVRGLQPLDDHTLRIRLNENFKFFLQFLAAEYAAIMPKDYAGLSEEVFRRNPVGTGPFRLAHCTTKTVGSKPFLVYDLEKNQDYFAPTGNLEAVEFYSANTPIDTATKEFFDLLYISNSEIPELSGNPGFKIINSSHNVINFLILNPNENSQMKDRRVRQMINYAINREELVRKVFQNQTLPAHSMMPFGLLGYNPYYRLDYSRADKIRAKLPPGSIRFTITTLAQDDRRFVAEFLRRQLARFNVDVKVVTVSDQYDYFHNLIYNTNTSVILGGIPDYPCSYHFLSHLVEPNGYFNILKITPPDLMAKIKMLPGVDTMEEARILAKINAAFENDSLFIPLYHNSNFIAIRNRIETIGFKYGEIIDFAGLEVAE